MVLSKWKYINYLALSTIYIYFLHIQCLKSRQILPLKKQELHIFHYNCWSLSQFINVHLYCSSEPLFHSVYSWSKHPALHTALFSFLFFCLFVCQCILSTLEPFDRDLGLGYSSQGDKTPKRCTLAAVNNEQVAQQCSVFAAIQTITGSSVQGSVSRMDRGKEFATTIIVYNPQRCSVGEEKIEKGRSIVCGNCSSPGPTQWIMIMKSVKTTKRQTIETEGSF